MNKPTSIVEINGSRYDAVSGALIGAVKKVARGAVKPARGLSIDGFTRQAVRATAHTKRSVQELKRHPQHSKTLMRTSVKKSARAKSEDKIKFRGLSTDHARADRARRVPQSSKVQRFGLMSFGQGSPPKTGEVIAPRTNMPARSAMAATATLPSVMTSASHYKLERLLDYAMAHADAHKKSLDDSTRLHRKFFGRVPRWLAIGFLAVVLLAIAGFIVWRQVPAASFKLATTRAHLNASMPAPISGYRIGMISSAENTVMTTIQSISDSSKKYIVTERSSNQPVASLAASAASGNSAHVQTVQDKDKTYILSQDENKSTAACTRGADTVSVEGEDLNIAQLLEAAKNAC